MRSFQKFVQLCYLVAFINHILPFSKAEPKRPKADQCEASLKLFLSPAYVSEGAKITFSMDSDLLLVQQKISQRIVNELQQEKRQKSL